jgi:hypothetical protein
LPIGSARMRFPVAAKIALISAGGLLPILPWLRAFAVFGPGGG